MHRTQRRYWTAAALMPLLAVLIVSLLARGGGSPTWVSAEEENATPPPEEMTTVPPPGQEWASEVGDTRPPGPDVLPTTGQTPDTSESWWYVPYVNEDQQKPVEHLSIAGIAIGPSVDEAGGPCASGAERATVPVTAVEGSKLDVTSFGLATTARQDFAGAVTCDGEAASAEAFYVIPPDPNEGFRGGSMLVTRRIGPPQAASTIPSDRWSGKTVAGVDAAVADPILDDPIFGESAVVIHEDGVTSIVHSEGVPLEESIEVMESILD